MSKEPMRAPSVPGNKVNGPEDLVVRMNESTSEDWDMVPFPARQQLGWHEEYEGGQEHPELRHYAGVEPEEMLHSRHLAGADQDTSLNLTRPVTYHLEATEPPAEPAGAPGTDGYNRLNRLVAPAEGFEHPADFTLEQGAGVRTFRLPEGVGLDADEQAKYDGTGPYAPGRAMTHADPRNQSDTTRQRTDQTPSVNDPYREADGSLRDPKQVHEAAPDVPDAEYGSTELSDGTPANAAEGARSEASEDARSAARDAQSKNDSGDGNDVPDGSVSDVMAWVGDDSDKARRALQAEQAKGKDARKSLVNQLNDKV